MNESSKNPRTSKKRIYAAGTMLALIISVPGIIAYIVTNNITDDFLISLTTSVIVFVISMGFSIKISKKLEKV